MSQDRNIHPDFLRYLELKDDNLSALFKDLRAFILEISPESNELLYHTYALTSVFFISEKMSDGFCTIPRYTKHMNLAFNTGTLLADTSSLLVGTGKLMRHILIKEISDYRNDTVKSLIQSAVNFAIEDMDKPTTTTEKTISKI